jgi:predicted nucleic-acid-binding protein
MRAIDTNVLVRLLVRDDAKQVAAAEQFIAKGAWVSLLTLMETTWVLASVYELQTSAIASVVGMLLDHQHLTLQDADIVTAALHDYRRKPTVGFSDYLILAMARKTGHLPLGTFDRNLAKLDDAQKL